MATHPHTVLVVDDDQDLRESVVAYLSASGYAARGAANGIEALALLRDGLSTCVILLDMRMPDMDGWRFRETQLRDARIADIPVIMFSAESVIDRRARELGITQLLAKPANPERVIELLEQHCRRGS